MKVEYSDSVTFLTEGMARAVCQRVRREQHVDVEGCWSDGVRIERDGVVVEVSVRGTEHDHPEMLSCLEEVRARIEDVGREAAEYEWLRPMFE